jgi:hypothetical protein
VRLNRCSEPLTKTHRALNREKLTVHSPKRPIDLILREDQRGKGWGRLIYRILARLDAETEGAVGILAAGVSQQQHADGQAFYRAIGCNSTPLRDGETSWCIETSAARRL